MGQATDDRYPDARVSSPNMEINGVGLACVRQSLSALIGHRWVKTYRILDTRYLQFGEIKERNGITRGEFILVIQCPWGLERDGRIVTGLDDARVTDDEESEFNKADPAPEGHTLLAHKLADLLHLPSDEGVIADDICGTVQACEADCFGGFRIHFSNGLVFSVFPNVTESELWRFIWPDGAWHLVVEGGHVNYRGDRLPPFLT